MDRIGYATELAVLGAGDLLRVGVPPDALSAEADCEARHPRPAAGRSQSVRYLQSARVGDDWYTAQVHAPEEWALCC